MATITGAPCAGHFARTLATGLLLSFLPLAATAATINGTPRADRLRGTYQNDRMDGKAGNDHIKGFAGNDNLLGGAGNDTVVGGPGNDVLHGGLGNDVIHGSDVPVGRQSPATVGRDQSWGGSGDDRLYATGGGNRLYGDAGNDSFWIGFRGQVSRLLDKAWGGEGNDSFGIGEGAKGTFLGEAGNDSFDLHKHGLVTLSGGTGSTFYMIRTGGSPLITITDFKPDIDRMMFEDFNGIGVGNEIWLERFDANNDGMVSRLDGVSQTDGYLGSYSFVAAMRDQPAGLRMQVGPSIVWLPGVDHVDMQYQPR